ncbi:Generative cell specific-1 [Balamuthia mandrillaris]
MTAPGAPVLSFSALAVAVVVLSFLINLPQSARGAIIASSKLESCIADGSTEEALLNCKKKMVVSLTLEGGQNATEAVEAVIETVEEDGKTKRLEHPWRIRLSKSQPRVLYPIVYIQRVNNAPKEKIEYPDNFFWLFDRCDASATSDSPTCGWYHDSNGKAVLHSQGFCCECDFGQVLQISNEDTRAGLDCKLWGTDSSSAHCLRFDTLWYDAFEIGTAETFFDVTLNLIKRDSSNDGYVTDKIVLSPENTIVQSADKSIFAKLIGDFAPWKAVPVLSEKIFFVPSVPRDHPRVLAGSAHWMLVDKSRVDFSGTVCNKIGVSFEAFRYQPDACSQLPSSCLRYQLEDYHTEDIVKESKGLSGSYFVKYWGKFVEQNGILQKDSQRYLSFELEQLQASLVTLTFSADDIRFITNLSPGRIVVAVAKDFEALSKEGKIEVMMQNTGFINADFQLTVTNCTVGIKPIQARILSVSAKQSMNATFNIYSEHELLAENKCKVSLLDAVGQLQDFVWVNFTTFATKHTNGTQGGASPDNDDGGRYDPTNYWPRSCSQKCPNFINLICFIMESCWGELLWRVVIILVLICCCCCCCKCASSKKCRGSISSMMKGGLGGPVGLVCSLCCSSSSSASGDSKKIKAMKKKMKRQEKMMAKEYEELEMARLQEKHERKMQKLQQKTERRKRELTLSTAWSAQQGDEEKENGEQKKVSESTRAFNFWRKKQQQKEETTSQKNAHPERGRSDKAKDMLKLHLPSASLSMGGSSSSGKVPSTNAPVIRQRNVSEFAAPLTKEQLLEISSKQATIYINISDARGAPTPVSAGPSYSLVGKLLPYNPPDSNDVRWVQFWIPPIMCYQHKAMVGETVVELIPPVPLKAEYTSTIMDLVTARRFLNTTPLFPCINRS